MYGPCDSTSFTALMVTFCPSLLYVFPHRSRAFNFKPLYLRILDTSRISGMKISGVVAATTKIISKVTTKWEITSLIVAILTNYTAHCIGIGLSHLLTGCVVKMDKMKLKYILLVSQTPYNNNAWYVLTGRTFNAIIKLHKYFKIN